VGKRRVHEWQGDTQEAWKPELAQDEIEQPADRDE
jgi:hypothetical protein